jgi:hypothetical protein
MSQYRRPRIEGGIFFFTVALADRSSELLVQHIHRYVKDGLLPADWGGDMAEIQGRFGE